MITFFRKFTSPIFRPLYILLFLISFGFIYSYFYPIPTDIENLSVGISSKLLDIGDRSFYMPYGPNFTNNFDVSEYGYGNVKPSFLYPFILEVLGKLTGNIIDGGEGSKLWNLSVMLMTSILSILNLFLIEKISFNVFGDKVSKISSWIYTLFPYTIFYSLNGGITMYMVFGNCLLGYVVTNSCIFSDKKNSFGYLQTFLYLLLSTLYLSSLRPNGAIFSIIILFSILFIYLLKVKNKIIKFNKNIFYSSIFIFTISLLYCFNQLFATTEYIKFAQKVFISQGGLFFGIDRNLIRERIFNNNNLILDFKKIFFYLAWKISEFVGGLSDIRDSHSDISSRSLFPFFSRVFTGLFFIYPINIFALLGITLFWQRILKSGLFIIILASLVTLFPSFYGVAMSRYLIMVYPPFIICAASLINKILTKHSLTSME